MNHKNIPKFKPMKLDIGTTYFFNEYNPLNDSYLTHIYYSSLCSGEYSCLIDIDLSEKKVIGIYAGNDPQNKKIRYEFRQKLDPLNADIRGLSITGTDNFLIQEAKSIINDYNIKNPNERYALDIISHIESTINGYSSIINGDCLESDEIKSQLINIKNKYFKKAKNSDIYCGITDDIDLLIAYNKNEFKLDNEYKIHAFKCSSVQIAKNVLLKLKSNYTIFNDNKLEKCPLLVYIALKNTLQ